MENLEQLSEEEKRFKRNNKKRVRALSRGDYPTYATYCNDMGIEPEDKDAYQKGIIEIQLRKGLNRS